MNTGIQDAGTWHGNCVRCWPSAHPSRYLTPTKLSAVPTRVLHSPILDAVRGWLIVIQDPDGNRIRHTLESHGVDVKPAITSPWLAGKRPARRVKGVSAQ